MGGDSGNTPLLLALSVTDPIPAFHLPGLPDDTPTEVLGYGRGACSVHLRHPVLTAKMLEVQAGALMEAGQALANRTVDERVALIDGIARRFQDPADGLRRTAEAALPAITGYSPPMVREILDGMAADWRADRLRVLLAAEFPDPTVLEGFRPRAGVPGRARAFGPRLITHIFSGNVPGVAVTSLVRALLVGAPSLGKTASGEPLLAALFARAVAEADPEVGRCLGVAHWPGDDEALLGAALAPAETIVVYGGGDAVRAIRVATPPAARVVEYGHRLSLAVITAEGMREYGAEALARRAAEDVALFDQRGCVSPHVVYVQSNAKPDPRAWSGVLAESLADAELRLPRGRPEPEESAAIRQLRSEAAFTGLAGGADAEVHESPRGTAWTVLYEADPAFAPSCLHRTVRVKPVADLDLLPRILQPLHGMLQTVGVAAPQAETERIADLLGRLGASRITPLGRMAWPPAHWHHDGRPPLGDLVRWCDVESEPA